VFSFEAVALWCYEVMNLWLYDGMNSKALLCKKSIELTAARAWARKGGPSRASLSDEGKLIPQSTFYKYVKH
jgi:hypothetical protein